MIAVAMLADSSSLAGAPVVILHVFSPAPGSGEAIASVCAWFSLSAAESRVVKLLVAGRSVAELALHENLKEDTVRTYLKSVFRKTNTKSQSDLVRLMLANPVRLRLGAQHKL